MNAAAHPAPLHRPRSLVGSRYELRLARTREEVDAALRPRFEVFNLEVYEGLAESFFTGLDEDEFDRFYHHLIVIDETTGNVVGT